MLGENVSLVCGQCPHLELSRSLSFSPQERSYDCFPHMAFRWHIHAMAGSDSLCVFFSICNMWTPLSLLSCLFLRMSLEFPGHRQGLRHLHTSQYDVMLVDNINDTNSGCKCSNYAIIISISSTGRLMRSSWQGAFGREAWWKPQVMLNMELHGSHTAGLGWEARKGFYGYFFDVCLTNGCSASPFAEWLRAGNQPGV